MSSASHAVGSATGPSTTSLNQAGSRRARAPWYIWTGVVAVTSASLGGAWDVSWHRSIGRDSFWTPAHMLIYACGVLAGIVGMWLVLNASTGRDPGLRRASVQVLGLHAPLGVFLAGWGGLAMITSAPFDNWWHNAYGLDVKIVSPPHALLILGIRMVSVGMMLLILAAMNRAADARTTDFKALQRLFLYLGGLAIGGQMFFLQEFTGEVRLHRVLAYLSMAVALPVLFAAVSQASRFRWAATVMASIYMLFLIAEILILPLFPAQPKLGPVFYPVTHFVPAKFPVLIVFPALALDLFWQRARSWKPWTIALISGVLFVAVLFAVEWPFAKFLLSKASENRFFGSIYFDYGSNPAGYDRRRLFFNPQHGWPLASGLLLASFYAMISTWIGLTFGRWMRGVRR